MLEALYLLQLPNFFQKSIWLQIFKGQLETKELHMKPGEMKWSEGREWLLSKCSPIVLLDCGAAPCEKL